MTLIARARLADTRKRIEARMWAARSAVIVRQLREMRASA